MKKGHPIFTIFLFFLGWVFMYADRNILSPVMGDIGAQWDLNKAELGLMSTVFLQRMQLCRFQRVFGRSIWSR